LVLHVPLAFHPYPHRDDEVSPLYLYPMAREVKQPYPATAAQAIPEVVDRPLHLRQGDVLQGSDLEAQVTPGGSHGACVVDGVAQWRAVVGGVADHQRQAAPPPATDFPSTARPFDWA